MQGIRFYLEYSTPEDKRKATRKEPGNHSGNVFAAYVDNGPQLHGGVDGAGAVYYQQNSPCASTSSSWDYLSTHCLRISERRAREIHPELFRYLEVD